MRLRQLLKYHRRSPSFIQHHKLKQTTAPPAGWDGSLQPTHSRPVCVSLCSFFFRGFCVPGRLTQLSPSAAVWAASCGPSPRSSSSFCSGSSPVCRSSSVPGISQPVAASSSRLQKNKEEFEIFNFSVSEIWFFHAQRNSVIHEAPRSPKKEAPGSPGSPGLRIFNAHGFTLTHLWHHISHFSKNFSSSASRYFYCRLSIHDSVFIVLCILLHQSLVLEIDTLWIVCVTWSINILHPHCLRLTAHFFIFCNLHLSACKAVWLVPTRRTGY